MSWGYANFSTTSFSQDLQRKKQLIKNNSNRKLYKSIIGKGIGKIIVYWHDNRNSNFPSFIIIRCGNKVTSFNISNLKYQKDIYNFVEKKLNELHYISYL